TPVSSHRCIHLASSPSSAGLSGRRRRAGSRAVSERFGTEKSYYRTEKSYYRKVWGRLLLAVLQLFDLFAHEPLGDARYDVGDGLAHDTIGQMFQNSPGDLLDQILGDSRADRDRGRPLGRGRFGGGLLRREN